MCLAQGPQRSDAGEARTRGPSVSSQALYHCAPLIWWLLCALSLFSVFRYSACGYGTVKRQKRGNKEKKCNVKNRKDEITLGEKTKK